MKRLISHRELISCDGEGASTGSIAASLMHGTGKEPQHHSYEPWNLGSEVCLLLEDFCLSKVRICRT